MSAEVANLPAPMRQITATDVFANPETFEHAQRVAKVFAQSSLVPQHLRNNVADCLIAYQIARRLGEEPLTVFQNIYVINGKPGWTTAYMVSRANRSGVFRGRITWDESGNGDSLAVTAKAVLSDTGEEVRVTCDIRMAKAEQWTRNAKYQSMPSHMLRWRSAAMLIRLYSPEVMLGMPVIEEIETGQQREVRDVTPAKTAAQALDDFAGSIEHVIGNGNEGQPEAPDTAKFLGRTSEGDGHVVDASIQPEAQAAVGAATADVMTIPTTPEEYAAMVKFHMADATNADLLETRWREEKQLRQRLGVTVDDAKALGSAVLERAKELRG